MWLSYSLSEEERGVITSGNYFLALFYDFILELNISYSGKEKNLQNSSQSKW